jgi:hypothetical protein
MSKVKWSVILIIIVSLVGLTACDRTSAPPDQPPATEVDDTSQKPSDDPSGEDTFLGPGKVESVQSVSEGETSGEIIVVQVTNPTEDEVVVTIPCGLIFEPPPGSDEQRLMVIQSASATLAPGESTTLSPYVICIDSSRGVPEYGSTYQIGTFASNDLLKLAECICSETLADVETDPMGYFNQFGLQFAIWSVSDGLSFDELTKEMEDAEGALGQITTEGLPEEFQQAFESFMGTFLGFGQEWLEKCDLEVNP